MGPASIKTMNTILTIASESRSTEWLVCSIGDFFSSFVQEVDVAAAEVLAEFPKEQNILNFFAYHPGSLPCIFSMRGDLLLKHAFEGLTGDMYDPDLDFHLWFAPTFSAPGKPTLRTSSSYEVNLQFPLIAEGEFTAVISWVRARSLMLTGVNLDIKRCEIWDGVASVVLMIEGHTLYTARILFHEAIERQKNPGGILVDYQIACHSLDDYRSLKSIGLVPFSRSASSKLYFEVAEINPNFGPNPFAISSLSDSVPLLEALEKAGCQRIFLNAGCLILSASENMRKDDLPYISILLQCRGTNRNGLFFTIGNSDNAVNSQCYVAKIKNWANKHGMLVKKVKKLI